MRASHLKIAIVAPPFGSTGGPEIATQNLVDGLLELDQDVTLFAPSDWKTKAEHIHTLHRSLWNMKDFLTQNSLVRNNYRISSQLKPLLYNSKFDIFHFNSSYYAYAAGIHLKSPHILTLHNRIKVSSQLDQINAANFHIVAVTKSQKKNYKISSVIHHGIPIKDIKPNYAPINSYLITIGRITDQKGIHISIEIAKKAKKKLIIIGRIGNSDDRQKYFKEKILPYIDNNQIVHIEAVSREEIHTYLREAEALLFPITKPETFGLVIAESLACATPIIASRTEPLPEILPADKNIAVLSDNINELTQAAKNTSSFNRKQCRQFAEKNFDNVTMAKKYLKLYTKLVAH